MKCIICGEEKKKCREHIIPQFMGNKYIITKRVCEKCNNILGGTIEKYYSNRQLIKLYRCLNSSKSMSEKIKELKLSFKESNGETIDKNKIYMVILKMAFEFGFETLGEEYLDDPIAKAYRESLISVIRGDEIRLDFDKYIKGGDTILEDTYEDYKEELLHSIFLFKDDKYVYAKVACYVDEFLPIQFIVKLSNQPEKYAWKEDIALVFMVLRQDLVQIKMRGSVS